MPRRIVLLSGRVRSGKSSLASALQERYGATPLKTRQLIKTLVPELPDERRALQEGGERLDRETEGKWIAKALFEVPGIDRDTIVVVDSVRIAAQVEAVRRAFRPLPVTHIHLTAQDAELEARFNIRREPGEATGYADVSANATEAQVETLGGICDVLIDTSRSSPADVVIRAAARIGLYQFVDGAHVDVLIGGQYGSEGKGHIAWFLSPEYDFLMRVGGPNAGHTVRNKDDKYTFHLLPSGTLNAPRAGLIIGPGATLWVPQLLKEINDCDVGVDRLFIDPRAMIIEQADKDCEIGLRDEIASTAQGGGMAAARRLMRGKLRGEGIAPVRFAGDLDDLRPYVRPTCDVLDRAFSEGKRVFLEGTQGSGLSLFHGDYPHVTARDCTVSGTMSEAGIPPMRVRRIVMVARTYPIRVQNPDTPGMTSGYMSKEITFEEIARRSGLDADELRKAEKTSTTGRQRRIGEFDWELFRRACSLNGPTDIALTFTDYLCARNSEARRFEQLERNTIMFIEELERVAGAPVSLISTRFHERSILDRRMW